MTFQIFLYKKKIILYTSKVPPYQYCLSVRISSTLSVLSVQQHLFFYRSLNVILQTLEPVLFRFTGKHFPALSCRMIHL